MSFEEKYREEMKNQRLSDEKRLEIQAQLAGVGEKAKHRRLRKPWRMVLIAAALATTLALTAAAAVHTYLGDWEDFGDGFLHRGLFGNAHLVGANTIELPHFLFADHVSDNEEELKIYVFLARDEETLFDRIIDVKDEVDASPDHAYTYNYADDNVRASFTVKRTETGIIIERDYAIRDLCTGEWKTDNSIVTRGSNTGHAGEGTMDYVIYAGDDPAHTPCYVPTTWSRGDTVTGYGINSFPEEED